MLYYSAAVLSWRAWRTVYMERDMGVHARVTSAYTRTCLDHVIYRAHGHVTDPGFHYFLALQSPKKVGEDIQKATMDWKGLKITVKLTIQNRQVRRFSMEVAFLAGEGQRLCVGCLPHTPSYIAH